MRKFILLLALICGAQLSAQRITGRVLDMNDQSPIPQATVVLMQRGQEGPRVGTDANGTFDFQAPRGQWMLVVRAPGYAMHRQAVEVATGLLELGDISLDANSEELAQAEVRGRAVDALNGLDRKVYNMGDDLQVQGGTGTDVLRQVPNVSIDIDGNIALRGDENVTILIDGRPASLLGLTGANAFDRIPSANIERVEVVTNPGAKFDASGTGGILNIVTKKDRELPFNGNFQAGAGTNDKYNSNVNVSIPIQNFRLTGGINWGDRTKFHGGTTFRNYNFADTTFTFDQYNYGTRRNIMPSANLGLGYVLNKVHMFNVNYGYNIHDHRSTDSSHSINANEAHGFETTAIQNSDESAFETHQNFRFRYERKFDDRDKKWTIDANFGESVGTESSLSHFINDEDYPAELLYDGAAVQRFENTEGDRHYNIQTDIEWPISDKERVDFGGRFYMVDDRHTQEATQLLDPVSSTFTPDTLRSFDMTQNQYVAAAYATYGYVWNERWKAQVGMRYELAQLAFEVAGQEPFTRQYPGFFPSVYLTHTPKKGLDYQLSYALRVNRPRHHSLNPVINYSNPQSLRRGNPDLMPEYTHIVEASTVKFGPKGSVSSSMYVKHTTNMFSRYLETDPSGLLYVTWANYDTRQAYGFSGNVMWSFNRELRLNASADAFYTTINGENLEAGLTQAGFGYQGRSNMTWTPNNRHQIQASYNVWGGGPSGQGYRKAIQFADVAYKWDIIPKRLFVTVRFSDIFTTRRFNYIQESDVLDVDFMRYRESRINYVTLQYNFGKQERGQRGRGGSRGGSGMGGGDDFGGM